MALISAYTSPGVTVVEDVSPSVTPITAIPSSIAIVGPAAGFVTATERFILTGTTAQTLTHTGVDTSSVSVVNITNNSTAISGSGNYTIAQSANPDGVVSSGDEVYTIVRVSSSTGIASGDTVQVTYNYTDKDYFTPTLFENYSDVVSKYGAPFGADGTISSKLSFAIRLAFINGAQEVIGLASVTSGTGDIATALIKLLDVEDITLLSVVSGDPSDHASLAAHCTSAASNGLYRMGIVGEDSSAQSITAAALRTTAKAYNVENVMLVSPSSFNITNPATLKPYAIGAQYMASALLGMFAARDAQIPLTRKTVAGFTTPNETRTNSDAALDSASGLCVVEYKGTLFRVRHSLTTAVTDVNKREASVVRAKYELARQLREVLDGSIVGIVVPQDQAPTLVSSAVANTLETLKNFGTISGYANIAARVLASNPTMVEVRFEYTPAYPINNISIIFTINTTTGDFALTV